MKNLILLLILVMPFTAMAQDDMYSSSDKKPKVKIANDVVNGKGERFVFTKTKVFANTKDKGYFSFGAGGICFGTDTIINLDVRIVSTTSLKIEKGMMLLLKTFKGNIITLHANTTNEDYLRDAQGYYDLTMSYELSSEQIESLKSEGLAKVRAETKYANFDKEYKNNKAGEYISACIDLIISEMRKPKNFTDGF